MTGFHSTQRNASLFDRLACIWLVLFFVAVAGPSATTSWLCDVVVAPVVSAHDQPGEHPATTSQQLEAENDFSKDALLVPPSPVHIFRQVQLVCFTFCLFFCFVSLRDRWLVPACPRPPPHFLQYNLQLQ